MPNALECIVNGQTGCLCSLSYFCHLFSGCCSTVLMGRLYINFLPSVLAGCSVSTLNYAGLYSLKFTDLHI